MIPELLPCPFCGDRRVSLAVLGDARLVAAYCEACGARGPDFVHNGPFPKADPSWKAAIAWNVRAKEKGE